MKYKVIIRCQDCMDDFSDSMGCNDGIPWTLGPFNTTEEAEKAGEEEVKDCSPWYYTIKEMEE